jgi:hypothetical protein
MNDERDLLLSFRAKSERWADRARAEAKAVRFALAQGGKGAVAAAAASRRLFRIVEFIRSANSRTINSLPAMINEDGVTLDEAEQFRAIADDILRFERRDVRPTSGKHRRSWSRYEAGPTIGPGALVYRH